MFMGSNTDSHKVFGRLGIVWICPWYDTVTVYHYQDKFSFWVRHRWRGRSQTTMHNWGYQRRTLVHDFWDIPYLGYGLVSFYEWTYCHCFPMVSLCFPNLKSLVCGFRRILHFERFLPLDPNNPWKNEGFKLLTLKIWVVTSKILMKEKWVPMLVTIYFLQVLKVPRSNFPPKGAVAFFFESQRVSFD